MQQSGLPVKQAERLGIICPVCSDFVNNDPDFRIIGCRGKILLVIKSPEGLLVKVLAVG